MKLHIPQTLGALVFVLMTVGSGQAIPLSDPLNGGTVTAGDKLFDQGTEIFQDIKDWVCNPVLNVSKPC